MWTKKKKKEKMAEWKPANLVFARAFFLLLFALAFFFFFIRTHNKHTNWVPI